MEYSVSCRTPSSPYLFRLFPNKTIIPSSSSRVCFPFNFRGNFTRARNLKVFAAAAAAGDSQCGEYNSCLNTPLEPRSPAGQFLAGVLLDNRDCFSVLVKAQLEQLAADRSQAVKRMTLGFDSDEAFLHSIIVGLHFLGYGMGEGERIAELKEQECQTVVQDLMYLLICYKFYGIRVQLVPRLSKCIYNGRLEICPSVDWALESIHKLEVLEMIKEHLTACVGWKANSNVTYKWDRVQIPRVQLCRVYTASILFGYFLKSASLRHNLEQSLSAINFDLGLPLNSHLRLPASKNALFDCAVSMPSISHDKVSSPKEQDNLRYYLMGFDTKAVQMCTKPRSKEALSLIERHSFALFGDGRTDFIETKEEICTSFATLNRLALEGIAFGSFLWETEQYIGRTYELEDN